MAHCGYSRYCGGTTFAGLRALYRPGYKLVKTGVMLLDLQSETVQQGELALENHDV